MPELGALRDKLDVRDYPFSASRIAKLAAAATLPISIDLSNLAGPVKNQGNIGSCVAQACASAREFLVRSLDRASQMLYSPLYLYYRARQIMGTLPQDSGLYTRDALKALAQWGIPEEAGWAYNQDAMNTEPDSIANETARPKRIYSYHRLDTLGMDEMRGCLAEGHPIILSMAVFGNLAPLPLTAQFQVKMPDSGETSQFGHAILVLGYYNDYQVFRCQNSWGIGWGMKGHFWLPYGYVAKFGWDAWVMVA